MKIWALFITAIGMCMAAFSQNTTKYAGSIGERYNIQMELSTDNGKDFKGHYRFEGRKDWIELQGALFTSTGSSQRLILQEFDNDKEEGTFELLMKGDMLSGTWRKDIGSPLVNVSLTRTTEKPSALDGYYYVETNEMKVHVSSETEMDVWILIPKSSTCKGIMLSGKLIKHHSQWVGSLEDENQNGSAAVLMEFVGENINIQINPAFLPGTGCQMDKNPYIRQMKRESGGLK